MTLKLPGSQVVPVVTHYHRPPRGRFPGRVLGSLSVGGNLLAADKGYFCINKSFEE